jgi:hypothetical protein
MTVGALIFYSLGLVGTALKAMLSGVHYFLQDTRIPEKIQKENTKKFVGEGVKKLSGCNLGTGPELQNMMYCLNDRWSFNFLFRRVGWYCFKGYVGRGLLFPIRY